MSNKIIMKLAILLGVLFLVSLICTEVSAQSWSSRSHISSVIGTSDAPALVSASGSFPPGPPTQNMIIFMAYKGIGNNPLMYYNYFIGDVWSKGILTSGDRGTSDSPALAMYPGLFMVWKGKGNDPRIFYSFNDGRDSNGGWSPGRLTSAYFGTSKAPALAVYKNKLYMAWKGEGNDPRIYYAVYDGDWSQAIQTPEDFETSDSPALTVYQNKLYMAWRGKGNDTSISSASFDGNSWSPRTLFIFGGYRTSNAPALAVYKNKLYMAWKGKANDPVSPVISYSVYDGNFWTPASTTSENFRTSDSPALAVYLDRLYMVWRGSADDTRIFYSFFR